MTDEMEESREVNSDGRISLSRKELFCYGVGHVLNDICASLWFTYLLVYFHLVLGFDSVSSGALLLIGQVADAISTPLVGFESDRDFKTTFKFGKRKKWHCIGTVFIFCSFPFIFTPCLGCSHSHVYAQMFYFGVFVIFFQFGWAAVQVSHLALIPELTPNHHQRTQLTAIRYCFTVISTVLVYVITWVVLKSKDGGNVSDQIGPKDAYSFRIVVFTSLSIGAIASLVFYWGVNEESRTNDGEDEKKHKTVFQFVKDIKFYKVAAVYMSSRLFVNLVQIYIPLYLHETLSQNAENLAVIPLLMYLGSVAASSFVYHLNKFLGRKISYIFGASTGIIACAWIKFGHHIQYEIYLISVLLGISGSILVVTALGLTADLIGFDTDRGAFVYGSMSFVDKLSNGIAVMVIQYLKCSSCCDYYQNVLTYVCGGAAFAGILSFLTLRSKSLLGVAFEPDEAKPLL